MSEKAEREYEDGRRRLETRVNTLRSDLRDAEEALRRYDSQRADRIYLIDAIDEIVRRPVSREVTPTVPATEGSQPPIPLTATVGKGECLRPSGASGRTADGRSAQ